MNLKFSMIDDAHSLLPHKDSILELFRNCFGRELDPALWDWAYSNNPSGNPIVSLCHASDKLVGHYAVIPFPLMHGEKILRACLSMTTMVDSSYRKYGLFVEQAQRVYARAEALGFGIVFGFPNKNSTPGFRKRLGWVLEEPDYVASVPLARLAVSPELRASLEDISLVKLAINDRLFMEWRLSKPNHLYRNRFPLIIKEVGSQEDIVAINELPLEGYVDTRHYKVLLDAAVTHLREYAIFPYQFGFKALDVRFSNLKFKKDMLMSDVF